MSSEFGLLFLIEGYVRSENAWNVERPVSQSSP